jgi:YVTN family beta-propeller protein
MDGIPRSPPRPRLARSPSGLQSASRTDRAGRGILSLLTVGLAVLTIAGSVSGAPGRPIAASPNAGIPWFSADPGPEPALRIAPADAPAPAAPTPSPPTSGLPRGPALATVAYETRSLHVGSEPVDIAYDDRNDELFVADHGAGEVSVVNGTTNTVVQSVPAGSSPWAVVYDPDDDTVVALGYRGGLSLANASVLNASSLALEGTVPLSGGAGSGAFDPRNGLVYASLPLNGTVRAINTSRAQAVANITLGGIGPSGIAFDSDDGDLYVTESSSNNVTEIGGTNDTPFGSIAVGKYPYGVAFDNRSDTLFVSDAPGYEVNEINGTTGTVTRSVTVGYAPAGIAYDGFDDRVYVANSGSGNVSVLDGSTGAVVGSIPAGYYPEGVTYDPSNHLVYVANDGTSNLTIIGDPLTAALNPPSANVDARGPATFSASGVAGIPPYVAYNWSFGDGTFSTGPSADVTHTYAAGGTYPVNVTVTDSTGRTATAQRNVTIGPAPMVSTPTASPPSADIDQSVSFTTSPSLGVPPYPVFHWKGLPPGCSGSAASVECANLSIPGQYLVTVTVSDSNGAISTTSGALIFNVYPDPSTTTPVGNRSSLDVGQSVSFTSAVVADGSGSDTYGWQSDPGLLDCQPSTDLVVDCVAVAPGWSAVNVTATDSDGGQSTAVLSGFEVLPDPTIGTPTFSSPSVDLGGQIAIADPASGGASGFTYDWHGLPAGCFSSEGRFPCRPTAAGGTTVSVTATDSNGVSVNSSPRTLLVNPALSGNLSASPGTGSAGATVWFTARAGGGSGSYEFAWAFGDGASASGPLEAHVYADAGSYTVRLWINDTANGSLEEERIVAISAPATSPAPGLPGTAFLALFGGTAAAAMALVLAVVLGRRRRRGRASVPVEPPPR